MIKVTFQDLRDLRTILRVAQEPTNRARIEQAAELFPKPFQRCIQSHWIKIPTCGSAKITLQGKLFLTKVEWWFQHGLPKNLPGITITDYPFKSTPSRDDLLRYYQKRWRNPAARVRIIASPDLFVTLTALQQLSYAGSRGLTRSAWIDHVRIAAEVPLALAEEINLIDRMTTSGWVHLMRDPAIDQERYVLSSFGALAIASLTRQCVHA